MKPYWISKRFLSNRCNIK